MPYKIYTYEDPYRLGETDFWEEISALPHFCVSRTLVNGLKDVMQDRIQGLICPLDDLVSFPPEGLESSHIVYRQWTENVGLRLEQYGALTALFRRERESGRIDEAFYQALGHNQTRFLDAIRLFLELGIRPEALDETKGNKEQRLFVQVLREVCGDKRFQFPGTPRPAELKAILVELARNELREYTAQNAGRQRDRLWYERAIQNTAARPLEALVVHGVHQFSPPQLRLLSDLEKMGMTIIFLFNEQKQFPRMYASWNCIYQCFGVPIHHDTKIARYETRSMQNASNALACALAELYEGRYRAGDPRSQTWYQLYQKVDFLEFANITEYADFISNRFDAAQAKYHASQSVIDRGNDVCSRAAVLGFLDEQVYTANREIHTLLKLYYPEYTKQRHFLSYPIGQFFSALYRLWDPERGEIRIDVPALKECLSSRILKAGSGETLLRTFYNLELLFDGITTLREFREKIAAEYAAHYDAVARAKAADPIFPLRQLSIYHPDKVTRADLDALIRAVEEIQEIARTLFQSDGAPGESIHFGTHFKNLETFLRQRDLSQANEEERALIEALELRLEKGKPGQSVSGTFRDLQEGLYYYLKQTGGDEGANWIVKNFEQIDGDILQSKKQHERGEAKVYHFACLSDRDLSCRVDDLLPWPLTESFLQKAYFPVDLVFQVYYTALGERESFLRCAVFHGLYYNQCDVRLSYVKQYGEETTKPDALLSILGLTVTGGAVEPRTESIPVSVAVKREPARDVRYRRDEMMSMFLCPYRFFLDYVMEDTPVLQGTFLYQKFYENALISGVWKRMASQPKELAVRTLDRALAQESAIIRPYFFFWKQSEILDLERRAKNYLVHDILEQSRGERVPAYQNTHMDLRRRFGKAKFYIDITEAEPQNPYEPFEALAKRAYPQKIYSLYALPNPERDPKDRPRADRLRESAGQYLNRAGCGEKTAIAAEWCHYCVHRGICMEPFLSAE